MSTIDGLKLRRAFGRADWKVPEPFGPDGWRMFSKDGERSVIVSAFYRFNAEWLHASIAGQEIPSYEDLLNLHFAVWGTTGYAYQCFVPSESHINIHPNALHLWGRADGAPILPDFGKILGSI